MSDTKGRGFTLIELLVVIAIIGILAAMLFPVFARARESARKVQCLSGVKNIAMAIQMYLNDWDRFPPSEHRPEVIAWFEDYGGTSPCYQVDSANPYLRWPVVLEEYIKNRDVWRCPSARFSDTLGIAPVLPDWFTAIKNMSQTIGINCYGLTCRSTYPPGWGGSITDSFKQQICAYAGRGGGTAGGPFEVTIATNSNDTDLSTSAITDPGRHVVAADGGVQKSFWEAALVAYPDMCRLPCATCDWGPAADWDNCPWTQECGAGERRLGLDSTYRKSFIRARHLGGVNLGFADGHAKWMSSEAVLTGAPDWRPSWIISDAEKAKKFPALEGLGLCRFPVGP